MTDPRVCKTPMTEFNHLDMAEIAEFERMDRGRSIGMGMMPRFLHLWWRRVDPDRGHNKGNAA